MQQMQTEKYDTTGTVSESPHADDFSTPLTSNRASPVGHCSEMPGFDFREMYTVDKYEPQEKIPDPFFFPSVTAAAGAAHEIANVEAKPEEVWAPAEDKNPAELSLTTSDIDVLCARSFQAQPNVLHYPPSPPPRSEGVQLLEPEAPLTDEAATVPQLPKSTTAAPEKPREMHRRGSGESQSSSMSVFGAPFESRTSAGFVDEAPFAIEPPERRQVPSGVAANQFEEAAKTCVLVIFNNQKTPVSWYADLCPSDVREAILCACDAIIDRGFHLREVEVVSRFEEENAAHHENLLHEETVEGKTVKIWKKRIFKFEEFDKLSSGKTYLLEPAEERQDLQKISGDRWRRLLIQVEPLLHIEAQQALEQMKRGTNLLKHTRSAFPHLRQFQLSTDARRLVWYDSTRRASAAIVLKNIIEVRLGQTTESFKQYKIPMLEHLSASVMLSDGKTLDVTCKDEFEFDCWITGLKALMYHSRGEKVSKYDLLFHSRRFRHAVENQRTSVRLNELPPVEADAVSLDQCVELPSHSRTALASKLVRLRTRARQAADRLKQIERPHGSDIHSTAMDFSGTGPMEASGPFSFAARVESNGGSVAAEDQGGSPAGTQARIRDPRKTSPKSDEDIRLKKVNQLLWKAEVDIENVEDMHQRYTSCRSPAAQFARNWQEMNAQMAEELQRFGQQVRTAARQLL
eukprot:Polyplicarium_translucidae@DN3211_c0_g1_i2.p1